MKRRAARSTRPSSEDRHEHRLDRADRGDRDLRAADRVRDLAATLAEEDGARGQGEGRGEG